MDRPVFTGTFRGSICVMTGRAMPRAMQDAVHRHAPPYKCGAPTCAAVQMPRRKNALHKQADR